MVASVVLANSGLALHGVDPGQQPLAYLVAAMGCLGMLASASWFHRAGYPVRSQEKQHLTDVLDALQKKTEQLDSLQNIMSLTQSGADESQVIKGLLDGVSEQLSGYGPVTILAILWDEPKGMITIKDWTPQPEEGLPGSISRQNFGDLRELFHQFQGAGLGNFPSEDMISQRLRGLLGVADDQQLILFPLRASGSNLGVLGIRLSSIQVLTQKMRDNVQQLADVGTWCLQLSRKNEAQARQTRELQHEDELRRSFLSYITHEFKTPLASLKTSFELIQETEEVRGLDDPYQRLLINANRSVATLEQLTNDLAEVANISAGGVILNKTLTSPEVIVYPVIETTAPLSHLKNQSLEIEIRPDLPQFMADSRRLEQVLTNMVSNAIKYTPPGGTIRTVVSQQNGSIKFEVSDTGKGIPKEDLGKVFEPFYRVPQPTNDRTPGTGLGLALAKSLVELHGGKIWVESEVQKGSTFYFTIPIESRN
jgi:signal transduction histidine kinase